MVDWIRLWRSNSHVNLTYLIEDTAHQEHRARAENIPPSSGKYFSSPIYNQHKTEYIDTLAFGIRLTSCVGVPRIMYTVIGTLLFAVAVTLFTWSAVQYRQPVPPNWTGNTYAAMTLALISVVSLILSGAFYSHAYMSQATDGLLPGPAVAFASIGILCAGAFAMRRMVLQWRNLIRDPNAFGEDLAAANDSAPGGRRPVPGAPNGHEPRRRSAA